MLHVSLFLNSSLADAGSGRSRLYQTNGGSRIFRTWGRGTSTGVGCQPIIFAIFSEYYMNLKRNLTKRGWGMCSYQAPWNPLMLGVWRGSEPLELAPHNWEILNRPLFMLVFIFAFLLCERVLSTAIVKKIHSCSRVMGESLREFPAGHLWHKILFPSIHNGHLYK